MQKQDSTFSDIKKARDKSYGQTNNAGCGSGHSGPVKLADRSHHESHPLVKHP